MMQVIRTIKDLRSWRNEIGNSIVSLVPTMGYLHEGHLQLIEEANDQSDYTVLSLFVNPLQFGPNEDFDKYPRDEARDFELAEKAGVDVVFCPTSDELYGEEPSVQLIVTKRVNVLCGKSRPGHFDGVVTVVSKLFHLVQPHVACFGLKDAQQVAVIEGLVAALDFPVRIHRVATVREADGLAKSSRNVRLSAVERDMAPIVYEALCIGKTVLTTGGSANAAVETVRNKLADSAQGVFTIDYVEAYDFPSLTPDIQLNGEVLLAVACQFENARLIDNVLVQLPEKR